MDNEDVEREPLYDITAKKKNVENLIFIHQANAEEV